MVGCNNITIYQETITSAGHKAKPVVVGTPRTRRSTNMNISQQERPSFEVPGLRSADQSFDAGKKLIIN